MRQNTPVIEIAPSESEAKRDCWTVAFGNSFNDDERFVVAGYDNGDVKMFDLRTMSLYWETHLPNGVSGFPVDLQWLIRLTNPDMQRSVRSQRH